MADLCFDRESNTVVTTAYRMGYEAGIRAGREWCAEIAEQYDIEVPGKVIATAIRDQKKSRE